MFFPDLSQNTYIMPVFDSFYRISPKVVPAIILLALGYLIIRVLGGIAHLLLGLIRLPKGLRGILESLADGLLWVFLIIIFLQSLGLDKIALVFSGSIAAVGLALAAGASALTSDILGGIFLAHDRDFSVGDEVRAGEGPTEGVVESMDMRRTRIRDHEGRLHVVPNSIIERKEWVVIARKSDRA